MNIVQNQTFDAERAFYGTRGVDIRNCRFEGPADGESAFKECKNIAVSDCYWALRYPFWHVDGLTVAGTELTSLCRAALWYSSDINIRECKLHGVKALRECADVTIEDSSIISPEFGWSTRGVRLVRDTAEGEYFMMRATDVSLREVSFKGKYSFQYVENALFENCVLDTKDAFWHAKNVTVRNCTVKGEYLAWYCENVVFDHCVIIGTQPLCYCKNLTLIDCEMREADLAFEKSHVSATLTSPVISVKNPASGSIVLPAVCEWIRNDPDSRGEVIVRA
jgi:hypothetical protein